MPGPGLLAIASLVLGAMGSSAATAAAQTTPPDVIFHNGSIALGNDAFDVVEALAVRGGRVSAVGSNAQIRALADGSTRVVDLEGRFAYPGLYDNHVHLGVGDRDDPMNPPVDLEHVTDLSTLQQALREYVAQYPASTWIRGSVPHGTGGVEPFPEDGLPTRWDLDAAVADRPVALNRGHLMIVNSRALEIAGIGDDPPQPPGGRLDLNANGEPLGILRETPARRLITRHFPSAPAPTDAEAMAALRRRLEEQLALGVTSINVPGMRPGSDLRWIQQLYERVGEALPRLTVQIRLSPGYDSHDDPEEGIAQAISELEALSFYTNFGNDRLKIGAVKMSIDGAFSGQAAWNLEPYLGRPDYHGTARIPPEILYPVAKRAHDLGWQLGIHAIGDAAVVAAVDVLERVLTESPREDHRHYLHHISVRPPRSTIEKMQRLGIIASMQPNFTHTIAPFYAMALEGERLATNNPLRSLLDAGVRVSFGSDGLPDGPLVGIFSAVTRRGIDESIYGAGERVTVEEALHAVTRGSAYMNFEEDDRGTLEVGRLADLVVLEEDLRAIDPERIRDAVPSMTIIGGKVVYRRQ